MCVSSIISFTTAWLNTNVVQLLFKLFSLNWSVRPSVRLQVSVYGPAISNVTNVCLHFLILISKLNNLLKQLYIIILVGALKEGEAAEEERVKTGRQGQGDEAKYSSHLAIFYFVRIFSNIDAPAAKKFKCLEAIYLPPHHTLYSASQS